VHRIVLHVDVGGNWQRGLWEPQGGRGELAAFELAVLDGLSGVPVLGLGVQKETETAELPVFVTVVVIVAGRRVIRSVAVTVALARDVTLGL
jgi:hypothetical protein